MDKHLITEKFKLIDRIFLDKNYDKNKFKSNLFLFIDCISELELDCWITYKINTGINKISYFDIALWLLWNDVDIEICKQFIINEIDYLCLLYKKINFDITDQNEVAKLKVALETIKTQ